AAKAENLLVAMLPRKQFYLRGYIWMRYASCLGARLFLSFFSVFSHAVMPPSIAGFSWLIIDADQKSVHNVSSPPPSLPLPRGKQMGQLLSRKIELSNETEYNVELLVRCSHHSRLIIIDKFSRKMFKATMFHPGTTDCSMSTVVIIISHGGVITNQCLIPQDFIDNACIFFRFNENGKFEVTGISATTLIDQFCRIGARDSLNNGHFSGRKETGLGAGPCGSESISHYIYGA
ncbi:hypothetical protein LWI28_018260, partial [Acer negundo]